MFVLDLGKNRQKRQKTNNKQIQNGTKLYSLAFSGAVNFTFKHESNCRITQNFKQDNLIKIFLGTFGNYN